MSTEDMQDVLDALSHEPLPTEEPAKFQGHDAVYYQSEHTCGHQVDATVKSSKYIKDEEAWVYTVEYPWPGSDGGFPVPTTQQDVYENLLTAREVTQAAARALCFCHCVSATVPTVSHGRILALRCLQNLLNDKPRLWNLT